MTFKQVYSSDLVTKRDGHRPQFLFDARPAGCGKTHAECDFLLKNAGLYLVAAERIDAVRELHAMLIEIGSTTHTRAHIVEICSAGVKSGKPSVKTEIEALPHAYQSGHVIAIICHAGLLDADLSGFGNWSLIIDETPSVFESRQVSSGLTWRWLSEHFRIVPGDDLNMIALAENATAKSAELHRDSMANAVATLHRRAGSDRFDVFTDVDCWDALSDDPSWRWSSLWSPTALLAFDRVKVLANAFDRSLTFQAFHARHPELSWQRDERPTDRAFAHRSMVICYFARAHRASRGLFDKPKGQQHLRAITDWIRHEVATGDHIWTCNAPEKSLLKRLPGQYLTPRQAGSNKYQSIDAVTVLYSAKPNPAECQVLASLGIDTNSATETREYETAYQFVGRSSVRDARSSRPVRVFVYDLKQATYLAEMFGSAGYVDVELRPTNLGFLDWTYDGRAGRPAHKRSAEEQAEKEERVRTSNRERQRRRRERMKAGRVPSE